MHIRNIKYRYLRLPKNFIFVIACLFLNVINRADAQDLLNIKSGAVFHISPGAVFHVNGSLNNSGTLTVNGNVTIKNNWTNNGTQNSTAGSVNFTGSDDSQISGTGGITVFNNINVNKASTGNIVRVNSSSFSAPDGFLSLTSGIFRFSGLFTLTNTFFPSLSMLIPANCGFWLDNTNATVTGQNGDFTIQGLLRISNGTFNAGTGSNENNLLYSTGSQMTLEGGTLNINARFSRNADDNSTITYNQSGGDIKVGTASSNTSASRAMFDISSASSFTWSGGNIELKRAAASYSGGEFQNASNTGSVTGGNLKIDAASSGSTFRINSQNLQVGSLLLTGTNDPVVMPLNYSLKVLDSILLAGTGAGRLNSNSQDIYLGGDWINNLSSSDGFTPGSKTILFNGSANQYIRGSQNTIFNNVSLNKTGGKVLLDLPTRINGNLRLLSTAVRLDMQSNDLTIGPNGKIYLNAGSTEEITSDTTKYIINSGSGTDPLAGARLIRMLPNPIPSYPYNTYFPIGTPSGHSSVDIRIENIGASLGANPYIAIKPVPREHSAVEVSDKSLVRYWAVSKNDVTINPGGASVFFYYNFSDVPPGNTEGNYVVLWYNPSWNDPAAYWRTDPGASNNIVDFDLHNFYSQLVNEISGDWTAGEPSVAQAIYYSRQDGDYSDTLTWSKISFGGPPSNTVPNKRSDRVRIQNNTVTITGATAVANLISIENGTEG